MRTDTHLHALRSAPYFGALSDDELQAVLDVGRSHTVGAGELIFRQGDPGTSMLVILEGSADVFVSGDTHEDHLLHRLGPGETVGKMSLLTHEARSASVRAATDLSALEFDGRMVETLAKAHSGAMTAAVFHVARTAARRLKEANESAALLVRRQIDTARFFMFMVFMSCAYIVSADGLRSLSLSLSSALLGIGVLAAFAWLGLKVINLSMFPPSMYGITSKGLGRDLVSALGISAVLMLVLTAVKAVATLSSPELAGAPLLSGNLLGALVAGDWRSPAMLGALLYAVHSVFQEFLVRGCMQSSLTEFTRGVSGQRRAVLYGIVISNGFFAVMHVHISLTLALGIGLVGFLWGWMRTWQSGIWGICLSHVLIGTWALDILAIQDVFLH